MKLASANLPTKYGTFKIFIYQGEHTVLIKGKGLNREPVLVRIHSQCLTGDTFLSLRCDCREQLHQSMKLIQQKGQGVIIYLNQEGRGIGLTNKIKAYHLQDQGLDTVEANKALYLPTDTRDYQIAANILKDLGISKILLLTNNPIKISQLKIYGIKVVKRVPLEVKPHKLNLNYLRTKKKKLKHTLKLI